MRALAALSAAFLVLLFARIAWAEPLRPSLSLQRFAFLDAPPPAPPSLPPAPDREASEQPRKSWEILPHVGWTAPSCRTAPYGGSACSDIGAGVNVGIGGVYRITPYVGLGGELMLARFAYDAMALGASAGTSQAGLFGPIVRGYFLERGSVDPWVQVGFGMGFVGTSYSGAAHEWNAKASGAALSGAAGVDFWLTRYLKIGPSIGQQLVFPSEVRVCEGASCSSYSVSEAGGVTRWLRLGLNLTVALGQEM